MGTRIQEKIGIHNTKYNRYGQLCYYFKPAVLGGGYFALLQYSLLGADKGAIAPLTPKPRNRSQSNATN